MNSIFQQTILNNFANSIAHAIKDVGGDPSNINSLCDFPSEIRKQLVGGLDILAGKGITVDVDDRKYTINANSDAVLLKDVEFEGFTIKAGTTIQSAFEILFKDILPTLCKPIPNEKIDNVFKE